jgi:uncharacterized membrane protein YcaP (DUF421 family)
MVTKNTVDSDIYEMQERKAKMNKAILEKNGEIIPSSSKSKTSSSTFKKKEEEQQMTSILDKTLSRFQSTAD